MFISPITAIENGWVKFPDYMTQSQKDKCIQPNALDITVDHLYCIATDKFFIKEDHKIMRTTVKLDPAIDQFKEFVKLGIDTEEPLYNSWTLDQGRCYDAMSDFYVDIPEGIAAYLITRSTFNRNGVFIQSGLYDQGFKNYVGMVVYNMGGFTEIVQHTRIAQLIFVKSESAGIMYNGQYNNNPGQHWSKSE